MKMILDFLPLLLFFAAFRLFGIYIATGVAILASLVQVGSLVARKRRVEAVHWVTLVVIAVFGGLTLLLHDETFIKWKPTIVNAVLGGIVLGSQFVGARPAIQRLLGSQLQLPDAIWRRMNLQWGVFFLVLAAINVYVAFYYAPDLPAEVRTSRWVTFKVFGLFGLTLVFTVAQMLSVAKHVVPADAREPSGKGG